MKPGQSHIKNTPYLLLALKNQNEISVVVFVTATLFLCRNKSNRYTSMVLDMVIPFSSTTEKR